MDAINQYVAENKDKFISELIEFLKIPSISADSNFDQEVDRASEWLLSALKDLGMDNIQKFATEGHPIVYAEKYRGEDVPTILIYGHYDVQPPDPMDLWTSPPFEPVIKEGSIYARGASDDKGQMYMHLKAVEVLNSMGGSPCNIKFLLEGEEEVGSENLETFVDAHKELLAADIVLISDTSMISMEHPSIMVGLRGMAYMEVSVTGPNRDLHSGVYGGAIANPINVLCDMISSLKDEQGRITIPGFYDSVAELSQDERDDLGRRPFDHQAYCEDLGIANTSGEEGYTPTEWVSIRPTLDVNGIWGGYTGEGSKTVLPSKAFAKISMRLVPNQHSEDIAALFTKHFKAIAPETVKVEVKNLHGGEGAVVSTDSHAYQAAAKAVEEAFGKKPIPTRGGGSIPIVAMFQKVLAIDTILMGFGLNSDNIHSPNEKFAIENYLKGISTIPRFHHFFAQKK